MRLRKTTARAGAASLLLSGAIFASAGVAQTTSPGTSNTQATGPASGAQQAGCEGLTGTSRTDCENRMRGAGNTQGNNTDSSSTSSAGQADSGNSQGSVSDRGTGTSTSERTRISRGNVTDPGSRGSSDTASQSQSSDALGG